MRCRIFGGCCRLIQHDVGTRGNGREHFVWNAVRDARAARCDPVRPHPQPVLGADNRIPLVYELLFVTTSSSSVMRLKEVDVLNGGAVDALVKGERGAPGIASLKGKDLDGTTKPLVPRTALTLAPAEVTRLFFDMTFAGQSRIPRRLEHRFTFTFTPPSGPSSTERVVSGRVAVRTRPAVVIGPPLAGPRWIVGGGCCFPASDHRTATLPVNGAFRAPARFAIDFVQLTAARRLFSGPLSNNSSYEYFGAPVCRLPTASLWDYTTACLSTPTNGPANRGAQTAGGNYLGSVTGLRGFPLSPDLRALDAADADQGSIAAALQKGYRRCVLPDP
jgi:hypothetical protein